MGQTTELPDAPTDLPADNIGADELLSQLAGDEIDRLLAEAQADDAPVAMPELMAARHAAASDAGSAAPAARTEPQRDPDLESQLDRMFDRLTGDDETEVRREVQADETADETALNGPSAAGAADEGMAQQLDAVLSAAAGPAASPAPGPADAVAPTNPGQTTVAPNVAPTEKDASVDAAERGLLTASLEVPADDVDALAKDEPESERPASSRGALLRALVGVLEWVNAPFAWCPPAARNVLGLIAIVTLFNSLLLLAYMLVVRKG